MIITDKEYFLEDFLVKKLDLYMERACKKRKLDAVVLVDGDEGFGKTGISILCAYYIAKKSGREFSLKNIFFDPQELLKFINSTKKQIIIWDEAALGGLASGWASKIQQMLIQTLMTCRYRQHIIFFNVPKFYRLNRYFVSERPVGLIHVYSRDGIKAGRMTYYQKDMLEGMLDYWSKKKKKPYKVFSNSRLRGSFPDVFNTDIINEDEYEKEKDRITNKLLSKFSIDKYDKKVLELQYGIYSLKGVFNKDKAKHFRVSEQTITSWGKIPSKYPEIIHPPKELKD